MEPEVNTVGKWLQALVYVSSPTFQPHFLKIN